MHRALFLSLLLTAEAAVLPSFPAITSRALPPGCDEDDIALVEFNDGPTTSGNAGIGAEFETLSIQFTNINCNLADTFEAKRKTIRGRSGMNFVLSADTSVEMGAGTLSAEYVLDGRNIEVGKKVDPDDPKSEGMAVAAGNAAYNDLVNWQPWNESPPNSITIENYPQCPGPWTVRGLKEGIVNDIDWAPQITTSMPLEAIYTLMMENVRNPNNGRNILNGFIRAQNIQLVTADYFQALKQKVDVSKVNDAVLGFSSLVLSYAKVANGKLNEDDPNDEEKSAKSLIPFMPRTEFVTIYGAVRSFFPSSADDTDLFDVFNTLACYKTMNGPQKDNFVVTIDSDYCTGTVDNPVTGTKFAGLQYNYFGKFPKPGVPLTMSIKEWINGLDKGSPTPDLLTNFDTHFDGSIGGLGTKVEKMFKLDRTAPLFEFRDLSPQKTKNFGQFMDDVDSAIQQLHTASKDRPMRKVKRDVSSCILPSGTSSEGTATSMITPSPSIKCSVVGPSPGTGVDEGYCHCVVGDSSSLTLSIISGAQAYSESCAYSTVPISADQATITTDTKTWTSNCQACTLVGGAGGGQETCSTMSGCQPTSPTASITATVSSASTASPSLTGTPTVVAWVGNVGTIDIGDAENGGDGGKKLATEMFSKLSGMCNDQGCKADHQEMDSVEAVLAGEEEPLKPAMYISGAVYQNLKMFDRMLSVGLSSWISALENNGTNLCKEVNYEADAPNTGSGCGKGPIPTSRLRRKVRRDDGFVLWEREGLAEEEAQVRDKRCLDNCNNRPEVCHYKARMCNAPDSITVVAGTQDTPYANHLNIGVTLDKTSDGFDCEVIVGGLTALTAILAPELLEADALEGVELEAICGIIKDPSSILTSTPTDSSKRVTISRRQSTGIAA